MKTEPYLSPIQSQKLGYVLKFPLIVRKQYGRLLKEDWLYGDNENDIFNDPDNQIIYELGLRSTQYYEDNDIDADLPTIEFYKFVDDFIDKLTNEEQAIIAKKDAEMAEKYPDFIKSWNQHYYDNNDTKNKL